MYPSGQMQRGGAENNRGHEYGHAVSQSPMVTTHQHSPVDSVSRQRIPSYPGPPPHSPQYNRSHPTSPSITRLPPPSSPIQATRERASSGYYDPTQDSSDRPSEYTRPAYHHPRSPVQVSLSCSAAPISPQTFPSTFRLTDVPLIL